MTALARSSVFTKCRRPIEASCHASSAHRASCTSPATHDVSGLVHGSIQYGVSAAKTAVIAETARLTLRRNLFIKQRLNHRLELSHAPRKLVDCLALGIGELAMLERLRVHS